MIDTKGIFSPAIPWYFSPKKYWLGIEMKINYKMSYLQLSSASLVKVIRLELFSTIDHR